MSESCPSLPPMYRLQYEDLLKRALAEDLGIAGDITTDSVVQKDLEATGFIVARRPGRIAGVEFAAATFHLLDPSVKIETLFSDGMDAEPDERLIVLRGSARPILTAERTALNLLGRLCGIATATRDISRAISAYKAKVVCTRKTTPGLRALEKYAVRAGGGDNHRFGLDDAVLIKDNHRILAGGVAEAVRRARRHVGHMIKIEVEVDTLAQLEEALSLGVDAVLLDNMSIETLSQAVRMAGGKVLTEASGNITPAAAAAIAETGVDLISVGWITHSAPALDVSLDLALSA
jgi:nicotinate-nucleotide pyrophosphorylase (carboxylating)